MSGAPMFIQKVLRKLGFIRPPKNDEYLLHRGENCVISPTASFYHPERISIGDAAYIGHNTKIYGRGGVTIEDHTLISDDVCIMSSTHRYKESNLVPIDQVEFLDPVHIGVGCWIGIRVIILPGLRIGDGAIIGAGSVVTKPVAAGDIVAGNPARIVGQRDMEHFRSLAKDGLFYLSKKQELGLEKMETRREDPAAPPGMTP